MYKFIMSKWENVLKVNEIYNYFFIEIEYFLLEIIYVL